MLSHFEKCITEYITSLSSLVRRCALLSFVIYIFRSPIVWQAGRAIVSRGFIVFNLRVGINTHPHTQQPEKKKIVDGEDEADGDADAITKTRKIP